MTVVEITTFVPKRVGPNEEDIQLVQQQLQLVLDSVFFAVKQPLQPSTEFCMQLPGSLATPSTVPDDKWEEAGFTKFDSVEGGTVWMKPDDVQFYFSPELGVYVFVYPGGRVGIKTTGAEVSAFLQGKKGGSIVL